MRLRGRINQIERRAAAIKDVVDNTCEVPTGVWYADENGDVIPDSGPTQRVPKDQANSYGILLAPMSVDDEGFSEVVKKCEEYQETLQQQIE